MPRALRAVLRIASCCEEMEYKLGRFIDTDKREIEWEEVFAQDFGAGHTAAVNWAYSIWTRQSLERDPFVYMMSMDADVKIGVLEALYIAWGFD